MVYAKTSTMRLILLAFLTTFLMIIPPVFAGGTEPKIVDIKKYKFIPQEITIKAGETIKWTNSEKRQYHSVWFEQAGDPEPDYFFPGESYERTFDKPGVYPYRCGPHPEMTGTVTVE